MDAATGSPVRTKGYPAIRRLPLFVDKVYEERWQSWLFLRAEARRTGGRGARERWNTASTPDGRALPRQGWEQADAGGNADAGGGRPTGAADDPPRLTDTDVGGAANGGRPKTSPPNLSSGKTGAVADPRRPLVAAHVVHPIPGCQFGEQNPDAEALPEPALFAQGVHDRIGAQQGDKAAQLAVEPLEGQPGIPVEGTLVARKGGCHKSGGIEVRLEGQPGGGKGQIGRHVEADHAFVAAAGVETAGHGSPKATLAQAQLAGGRATAGFAPQVEVVVAIIFGSAVEEAERLGRGVGGIADVVVQKKASEQAPVEGFFGLVEQFAAAFEAELGVGLVAAKVVVVGGVFQSCREGCWCQRPLALALVAEFVDALRAAARAQVLPFVAEGQVFGADAQKAVSQARHPLAVGALVELEGGARRPAFVVEVYAFRGEVAVAEAAEAGEYRHLAQALRRGWPPPPKASGCQPVQRLAAGAVQGQRQPFEVLRQQAAVVDGEPQQGAVGFVVTDGGNGENRLAGIVPDARQPAQLGGLPPPQGAPVPVVVGPVHVQGLVVEVEADLLVARGRQFNGLLAGKARQPAREGIVLGGDGLHREGGGDGSAVAHRQGTAVGRYALDGVVLLFGRLQETLKQPAQLGTSGFFEHRLHIRWLRMPKQPVAVVGLHGAVERILSPEPLQLPQPQGGHAVGAGPVVVFPELPRRRVRRLVQVLAAVVAVRQFILAGGRIALEECRQQAAFGAVAGAVVPVVVVGIEPLVEPGMIALVGGQHAVKPVVAHLVGDDGVERPGIGNQADDRDHGVLHAPTRLQGALQGRHLGVNVGANVVGVKVGSPLDVGDGILPKVSLLVGKKGPGIDGCPVGQLDGVVEDVEAGIRKPGKIMDLAGREVEGLAGCGAGRKGCRLVNGGVAAGPPALGIGRGAGEEPGALGRGLQLAGSAHQVVGRQGEVDFEGRAEFAVVFAILQVRQRVPAGAVVDGGLGVPLGELVRAADVSHAGEGRRHLYAKRRFQAAAAAGQQGPGQNDLHDVGAPGGGFYPQGLPAGGEVEAIDEAQVGVGRKVEIRIPVGQQLLRESGTAVGVGIGPQVEVEQPEGVGRVVVVIHRPVPVQLVPDLVELNGDGKIRFLLEVGLLGGELEGQDTA